MFLQFYYAHVFSNNDDKEAMDKLQRVLNAAARIITGILKFDSAR